LFFVCGALIAFMAIGCILGASAGLFFFRPAYSAMGLLAIQAADQNQASVLPQQWQLQQIVAAALNSARRVHPDGQSLPSAASAALSHAGLAPISQTNLIQVSYTASDPAAAACMARKMMDACVATPATGPNGTKLQVAIETLPIAPDRPSQDFAGPVFGGLAGTLAGAVLFIAWVLLRAVRRARVAQAA
jgi:hypothetical protein